MKNVLQKGGISILGVLLFGVVIIFVLSYLHISVRQVVESPQGQDNINYVSTTSQNFWDKYLREPAHYLWHDVWLEIFWRPFIVNMKKIQAGDPTVFDTAAPRAIDPNWR